MKTRISNGGRFLEINPAEAFELVGRPFPDEWRDNVHFRDSHGDDNDDNKYGNYVIRDLYDTNGGDDK